MNLMVVNLILDSFYIVERIDIIVNRNSMVVISGWNKSNLVLLGDDNRRAQRPIDTIIEAGNLGQLQGFNGRV